MSQPPHSVLFEVPITFDVGARTVHSPMVQVKVNGIETKLILDTGATAHVLTLDLVRRARMAAQPTDPGTDHTGARVPSWSLGTVPIDIDGYVLSFADVQAIEGPAVFKEWGIGGFLSPQSLHQDGWVVIDLIGDALMFVEVEEAAMTTWLSERFPTLEPLKVTREPGEAVRILASIEPFGPVVTMLNTGTPETEFARSSLVNLKGTRADGAGFGVSGAEVAGAVVKDQTLRVGDLTVPIDTLFVRDEVAPEHPDGQIGMDVLRRTVLAISTDVEQSIRWMIPRPPGRSGWEP